MDIYERFLGFVDVSEKQTADALVLKLVEFLNASKLDKIPIIGQAYDGANVMSGHIGGVQAKLKIVHLQLNVQYMYIVWHIRLI